MNYIEHIKESAAKAYRNESKLDDAAHQIPGNMTGMMGRHFLNNLVFDNCNYLEVGVHQGSSFCSALYKNTPNNCYSIDNFCQGFGYSNIEENFTNNKNKFLSEIKKHKHLKEDCYSIDFKKEGIDNIDIYVYDGPHSENDHYNGIKYYFDILNKVSITVVDDWNGDEVRRGTLKAFKELHDSGLLQSVEYFCLPYQLEKLLQNNPDGNHATLGYGDDRLGWHNGYGVFLCTKSA
jgi:hypothetical protein